MADGTDYSVPVGDGGALSTGQSVCGVVDGKGYRGYLGGEECGIARDVARGLWEVTGREGVNLYVIWMKGDGIFWDRGMDA